MKMLSSGIRSLANATKFPKEIPRAKTSSRSTTFFPTIKKKLAKFKSRSTQPKSQPQLQQPVQQNNDNLKPKRCASLDHIYPNIKIIEENELRPKSVETKSQSSDDLSLLVSYSQFLQSLQLHLTHSQEEHCSDIVIDDTSKCDNSCSQHAVNNKSSNHVRLTHCASFSDVSRISNHILYPSVSSKSTTDLDLDLQQLFEFTNRRPSKRYVLTSSGTGHPIDDSRYQKSTIRRSHSLNTSSLLSAIIHENSDNIHNNNNSRNYRYHNSFKY
eukprot:Awhi_evm1s3206